MNLTHVDYVYSFLVGDLFVLPTKTIIYKMVQLVRLFDVKLIKGGTHRRISLKLLGMVRHPLIIIIGIRILWLVRNGPWDLENWLLLLLQYTITILLVLIWLEVHLFFNYIFN